MNALHLASFGGHLEIVKYLIPKFGDSRFDLDNLAQSCLHKAVTKGHPKVVRYLIEEGGFDPSLREKVSKHTCTLAQFTLTPISMYRMTWTASFWPVTVVS